MRFCTAANHRFADHAVRLVDSILFHGYTDPIVFNLGGLGFGLPAEVHDKTFQGTGCYNTCFTKWRSRAMHVPALVKQALDMCREGEVLVYMDADTQLLNRIDEIEKVPFAVGLTIRPEPEWANLGRANSGVIFFNRCRPTYWFIEIWQKQTALTGSVQKGLNDVAAYAPCNIAEFPTHIYNNYHNPDHPEDGTKIIHYRASMTDK